MNFRSSLQHQFSIISTNLQSVSKQLSQYQNLYGSAVAFPLPQFPGRTQEILLQQLLRTRLEPGVEEWMEQGQTVAQDVLQPDHLGKPDVDLQEVWEWAPGAANAQARRQHWGADYSRAEVESGIEKVISGLKRKLQVPEEGESSEEDEDDEEDEEEDGGEDSKKDVEMVINGFNFQSFISRSQLTPTDNNKSSSENGTYGHGQHLQIRHDRCPTTRSIFRMNCSTERQLWEKAILIDNQQVHA